MMVKDAKALILDFNRDPKGRKLQAFYRRKAMMEIMGKARDEESHSAFLGWLLEGKDLTASHSDTPLMWLLQILVSRENTVKGQNDPIPDKIKAQILSRTLEFKIDKVKTEEVVNNTLTHNYFNDNFEFKTGEEKDGQDRLDIYIKCSLTAPNNCGDYKSFEVFIENKVLSAEGGAKSEKEQVFVKNSSRTKEVEHDELKQTVRYYKALSYNNDNSNLQLFVFLAPEGHEHSESEHFFQVSYQDILDYILIPIIQNEDLSERSRFLIQEYIDGLSIPTPEMSKKKRIVMARTSSEKELISNFKSDYHDLIISCLKALAKQSLGNNTSFTLEDEILAKFATENKNLLYAVMSNSTRIKETGKKPIDYLDQLLECKLSKPLYIVYPDIENKNAFIICDDSNFGFEFLKAFAWNWYNSNKEKVDYINISNLIGSFIKDCWTSRKGESNGFFKSTGPDHFEKIPDFKFTLFANKSNWNKDYLNQITKKKWPFFKYEVLCDKVN